MIAHPIPALPTPARRPFKARLYIQKFELKTLYHTPSHIIANFLYDEILLEF